MNHYSDVKITSWKLRPLTVPLIALGTLAMICICILTIPGYCYLRGLPVCRSDKFLYAVNEDVLANVEPYLAEWAELPPSETEEQRRQIGSMLGVAINMWSEERSAYYTSTGERVAVVDIQLDAFYDWSRGILYVHEDVTLASPFDNFIIRQVDEHLYTYNLNQ